MATFDHLQKSPLASARAHPAPSPVRSSRQFASVPLPASKQDTSVTQAKHGHPAPLQFSLDRIPIFPSSKQNNTGLPDNLKVGVENLSSLSLDDVHVHYNSTKPAQVQALAYTQGADIYVGPRQEKHLPHEAWHVVQQKQGRVMPRMQMQEIAINNDQELEREATLVGREVVHESLMNRRGADIVHRSFQNRGVIQRMGEEEEEQLGPPPPLPPIPSKFVKPPPLPPKPSAIKTAKFQYPFTKAETGEKRPVPRDEISGRLLTIAGENLLDALYLSSTTKAFDQYTISRVGRVGAYARVSAELLESERRKSGEPETQKSIDELLNRLKPLIELSEKSPQFLSAQWPSIRGKLESDLEFFMTKTGRY